MKRDMDLIRQLLLEIESSEDWVGGKPEDWVGGKPNVPGYPEATIDYNLELLIAAGLVNSDDPFRTFGGTLHVAIKGLTWEGHDFLDTVRQESIWNKTKDAIGGSGFQSLPFTLLKETAVVFLREQLGLL